MKRREFLKLSAMSSITATMTGCGEDPVESLVPMLIPPPHFSPGNALHYATACRECTAGCGLVVKTREGRAIKIEGNPVHPFNKGKVCAMAQAALQGLYSPSRVPGPIFKNEKISWQKGIDLLVAKIKEISSNSNQRILFLGPPETSTLSTLIQNCLQSWGGGDFINIDLTPIHSLKTANETVFGRKEVPQMDISRADTIVNFGSDFLETWLNPVKFSHEYTGFHSYQAGKKGRFVQVSPHLSLTGINADRWYCCKPGNEYLVAFYLALKLVDQSSFLTDKEKFKIKDLLTPFVKHKTVKSQLKGMGEIDDLVKEFKSKRCICLAGGNSTADKNATLLHVAVNLINYINGEINRSIKFGNDYKIGGDSLQTVKNVFSKLEQGKYPLVIIYNVNPVYSLPQIGNIRSALAKAPFVVSLSNEADETAEFASLKLPTSHYLESWGDRQPIEGVFALQQPVMKPVPGYDTKEVGDLFLQVSQLINPIGFEFRNFYDYLVTKWQGLHKQIGKSASFHTFWKTCLQQGGLYQEMPSVKVGLAPALFKIEFNSPTISQSGFSLLGVNSPLHHANGHTGGRYWLLETPHPVSQVAWDSWVEINPQTALELGISENDLLELRSSNGSIRVVVRLFHGIAPNTLAMPTGLGRTVLFPDYPKSKGRLPFLELFNSKKPANLTMQQIGENVLSIFSDEHEPNSGDFMFSLGDVQIKNTGKKQQLAVTAGQSHYPASAYKSVTQDQFARGLYRSINKDSLDTVGSTNRLDNSGGKTPRAVHKGFYAPIDENVAMHKASAVKTPPDFFAQYKWELVIDLDKCTGCSACVVACYAENNIAVVGWDRMKQGREMSWLRIERFTEKDPQSGRFQTHLFPQMCAQCDNAGCEPVCPVSATYKTSDGLNAMIYNRCVGSRYCSNNCIYSQRRFNWRSYDFPSPLHYQLNPDVSVREKGVMEKCTFCYQRIREKTLLAKKENRVLNESEIRTACQQTCPTGAITFGNIKQSGSKVNKLKADSARSYTQFESMNYQPAITYLKKVVQTN